MERESFQPPESFINDPGRARDQAEAEKPFRDQSLELRAQADYTNDPERKSELLLQATFLDAQAAERSKAVAREQARLPVDETEETPLSDDIESTLAGMKEKFEHPVDEMTVKKYEALGIPRAVLEMGGMKPFDQLVDVRKNRLALYRMWRATGELEDTLERDRQLLEELTERRKLGKYDSDYPTDLRLKDAIANTEWNISLIEEVSREESPPNEAEFGMRLNELGRLFGDMFEISTRLTDAGFRHYNNPEIRNQISVLSKEWDSVRDEYHRSSYRVDWPQEFVNRVKEIHDRIFALTDELG